MDPNQNWSWFGSSDASFDPNNPNFYGNFRPPSVQNVSTPTPNRPQFPAGYDSVPQYSPASVYIPQFSPGAFSTYPTHPAPSPSDFQSAVNLDSSEDQVHVEYEEPAVTSTPKKKDRGKATTRGKRGGGSSSRPEGRRCGGGTQYSEAETECLARCWVDISQDPIVGNAQKLGKYWERIMECYNRLRPEGTKERTEEQLRSHWKRTKDLLVQFQQIYKDASEQYHSGESGEDIFQRALAEWQNKFSTPFKHLDAWNVIRDTPKFHIVVSSSNVKENIAKRTKIREDGSYTTTSEASTPSTPGMTSGGEFTSGSTRATRPIGTKKAKALARGKGKTSADIEEKFAAMQYQITRQANYEILTRDTTGMAPDALQNHLAFCAMLRREMGLTDPPPPQN